MKLQICMVTVGESITFEALESIKKNTPAPYDLRVWYDARGGAVFQNFLHKILTYTDDVIVSYKNSRLSAEWGFYTLYGDYDYLILACPDYIVKPGYFERMMMIFQEVKKAGIVGEAWRPMEEPYVVDDPDRGPDGIAMLKREAINDIGGISPSFNGRGPFHQELFRRMNSKGWSYVAVDGLAPHSGEQHEGRDAIKNWRDECHLDNLVWLSLEKQGFSNPLWWRNDIAGTERKQSAEREVVQK